MLTRKGLAAGAAMIAMVSTPPSALATETVKYTYDAKGRLVKVERSGSVNNGVKTEYTHDKANNRTKVKTTGSTNTPPP